MGRDRQSDRPAAGLLVMPGPQLFASRDWIESGIGELSATWQSLLLLLTVWAAAALPAAATAWRQPMSDGMTVVINALMRGCTFAGQRTARNLPISARSSLL